MKNQLQAKLKSRKGFTLIEMLIVVAIIAILVAVSIPLVTGSLNKARVATDQANERAARAAALVEYMTGENFSAETGGEDEYYYDAENGTAKDAVTGIKAYGQCGDHEGGIVKVVIDDDDVTISWVDSQGTALTGNKSNPHGFASTGTAAAGG